MIGSAVHYGDPVEQFPQIVQILTHSTRPFRRYPGNEELINEIRSKNIGLYIHSAFSTVPGNSSFRFLLETQYRIAEEAGALGLVIHIPNKKSVDEIVLAFANVSIKSRITTIFLEHIPGTYCDPKLIHELYHKLLQKYPKIKFGVCIDTCHIYASGYNLGKLDVMTQYLDQVENIKAPILVHLNDSVGDLGSGIDRHAPIGTKIWNNENRESLDLLLSKGWSCIVEYDFAEYNKSLEFIN